MLYLCTWGENFQELIQAEMKIVLTIESLSCSLCLNFAEEIMHSFLEKNAVGLWLIQGLRMFCQFFAFCSSFIIDSNCDFIIVSVLLTLC